MKTFREMILEKAEGLGSFALSYNEFLCYLYINDEELDEALASYDMDGMEKKILFVFTIKELENGLMTIGAIYAQKGYGPIAYKTAMKLSGGLTPTQDTKVTPEAQKVWEEFLSGKGSNDVKVVTFAEGEEQLANKWKYSTYSLKKNLNVTKNITNHKIFISQDRYGERKSSLDELADTFLSKTMKKIYPN